MRLRRSARVTLVGALVAVVLAGCTGSDDSPGPASSDTGVDGGDVIGDFAAAWPDPRPENFRGIVDQPVVAARDIAAYDSELGISDTTIDLTGELDCGGDECKQYVTVTHQLSGVGEWSYDTLIRATLNQGQWLVTWTPGTFEPDLSPVTTLEARRIVPSRAPIVDRTGVALTPERAIVRIGVVPEKVRPATYTSLAELLDIDGQGLRERVQAAQPGWFVPVIDLRKADYNAFRERLLEVPGISIDIARRALAPTSEWGRAVLGTVAPATPETLDNAGPTALSSDEVGATGLQYAFQQSLAGKPGVVISLVEKTTGDQLNEVYRLPPTPGQPLKTTLDFDAQNAAESAVAAATDTTAAVVVKASTGEILAAANAPGPTSYNTAFVGHYAPGSTYKTVSAAALLSAGLVTPRRPVTCPDTTIVGGKRFKNYADAIAPDDPTFADAFAASCNTTMVDLADRLTGKQLAAAGTEFGLGASWDLGLDAFSGSAPVEDDLVTRAADMIGQGTVEASPLGMAMVAAAVDSGVSRTPTLVPELFPGTRLDELDPGVVRSLQKMMRLVVTEGTGTSVDLPGPPVYAKTGTAEYQKGAGTGTNAWMIGYRGDVAFAVLVENGASGSHDAAPIVASLLSALPSSVDR